MQNIFLRPWILLLFPFDFTNLDITNFVNRIVYIFEMQTILMTNEERKIRSHVCNLSSKNSTCIQVLTIFVLTITKSDFFLLFFISAVVADRQSSPFQLSKVPLVPMLEGCGHYSTLQKIMPFLSEPPWSPVQMLSLLRDQHWFGFFKILLLFEIILASVRKKIIATFYSHGACVIEDIYMYIFLFYSCEHAYL